MYPWLTDSLDERVEPNHTARRVGKSHALAVAVIGAGVAGAAAARALADAGHVAKVFDKSRGAGGRLSTRREGSLTFDHGGQYFTVRDQQFARVARVLWDEGVLAQWTGDVHAIGSVSASVSEGRDARVVAVPGMSTLPKRMLAGATVELGARVERLVRNGRQWELFAVDGSALGVYDALVLAVPAPQAMALLEPVLPALATRLSVVQMDPCWAAMLHFDSGTGIPWPAAVCTTGPLAWLANDTSKPQRPSGGESWVLHASAAWSRAHLEEPSDDVLAKLLDAFFEVTGLTRRTALFAKAHRWRYARTAVAFGEPCAWDPEARVVACGDWCLGARVEAAFLSGTAAAECITASVTRPPTSETR